MKNRIVTIDVRLLCASGIGTYIQNLIPRVICSCPHLTFYLLADSHELREYPWAQKKNVTIIDFRSPIYSLSEQAEFLRKIPKDTCLFWSPHYNIPIFCRGRLLVTVHDVFHIAMPTFVDGTHKRLYARLMFGLIRIKADAVLTVSRFTENELVRLCGIKRSRIHAIYNGVDKTWFQFRQDDLFRGRPFLLYVGNVKPHKNLSMLCEAFETVKENIPHDLVIVGKKEGFITGDSTVISKAANSAERIRFTGYVSDTDLKQYFAHADALVFPSLYEGFGLPPLEAMASGCPVIASDIESLREVCGDAALYCDPYSSKDLADKIRQIIHDYELRRRLQHNGLMRAELFTWEKCSERVLSVIKRVLDS
ncbi:MAG: glycosyltransferase family 4 protein [Planctomycetes bacterium]|nr:glycosyltransferase family 4 protein [Planctomycetota bacterium]